MLSPKEQEILERYFRQEYIRMFKFACHLLGSENLAEVAVQDTFTVASFKFKQFVDSPNPTGWLYNVLKNEVRQIRRDRQKALERYVSLDSIQEPSTEMPEISMIDVSKNADLQLISKLYVTGYSLEEIAEDLGISVPALKMRMSRARKRLREDPEIKKIKEFE